jgi:hypothetical protein
MMYFSDYESFVKSPVWKEIVETLTEVKEGIYEDFKKFDPNGEATNIARHQGRLLMIDFILALPYDIKREIEETNRKLKNEEETDE